MNNPKSVWMTAPRAIEIRDEPGQSVNVSDVRVRAVASAISHGTELLVYRGQVPADLPLDLPTLRGSFHFPICYGYASVGRVVEVGAGVTDFGEGDLVFVHHPHQTEYVVPSSSAVRLPGELPPTVGIFLANVETALNIVLDAHPRLGDRVVIFGQGVVGLLLTQLVRRAGAAMVVAVEPIAERRTLALRCGADLALAPNEQLIQAIRERTDGVGADLAIESSGDPRTLDAAIESVGFEGTVVVSSWYGTKTAPVQLGGSFHRSRLRLISSQVSQIDAAIAPRWSHARRLELARDLLSTLLLQPLISHHIPFDCAADAYALIDRHPEETVQVVLTYSD